MKPSWMPENPYPKTDNPGTSSTAWYGEGLHVGFNEGSITTAKAVLEYMIKELPAYDMYTNRFLKQMLKEIDA